MAAPILTSVTPSVGHTGGGTVLRIVGANFQLPAAPPLTGPVPVAPASVRVFVGGVEARLVRVASSTVLYVTTERHDPGENLGIEVRNVGPHGETIGSETTTLAGAYKYARPVFTNPSDLERVIKSLVNELKRQVHPEVVYTAHIDWTDEPSAILKGTRDAKVPCVFLAGPVLRPNNLYRTHVRPTSAVRDASGAVIENIQREHRAPLTDDLVFTIGALTNKSHTMVSMVAVLRDFELRNPFLWVEREAGSSELVKFELFWEGDLVVDSNNDESNIRTASTTISLRGFDTLAVAGFDSDQAMTVHPLVIDEVELETVRTGS